MLGLAGLFSILGILLLVTSCAAGIWLTVVAFKRSVLWGLLVMFIPGASLVFIIKYWQEARKPFLAHLATGVAGVVFFFTGAGMAVKSVTPEMAQKMMEEAEKQAAAQRAATTDDDSAAPAQPRAAMMNESSAPVGAMPQSNRAADTARALSVLDAMPQSAGGASATASMMPTTIAPGRTSAAKPVYDVDAVARDGFAPVAVSDAGQIIGRRVKVVTTSGQVHKGEMLRADGSSLSIERWLHGGSAVLDFSKAEIQSLHVQVN